MEVFVVVVVVFIPSARHTSPNGRLRPAGSKRYARNVFTSLSKRVRGRRTRTYIGSQHENTRRDAYGIIVNVGIVYAETDRKTRCIIGFIVTAEDI